MTESAMSLREFRKRLGLNQQEFSERMGMPLRTYQDIETNKSATRPLHMHAAERVALQYAVEKGNPMLVPGHIRKMALQIAHMIEGTD